MQGDSRLGVSVRHGHLGNAGLPEPTDLTGGHRAQCAPRWLDVTAVCGHWPL